MSLKKSLTSALVGFSVIVALALVVVLVDAAEHIMTLPHGKLRIAWTFIPVFLILIGAYGLHAGSSVARIALGLIFSLMSITFLGYSALAVLIGDKSVSSVLQPLLWGSPLAVAAFVLLFSRFLRSEQRQSRGNRASS